MLPDLLKSNLDVVFCGTAAGTVSASRGSYYAGPGNKFYPILYKIGFTQRLLRPEEFPELLKYGIGLTDIVKTEAGSDRELPETSFDIDNFILKIIEYQPKIVAFNGKKAASWALGYKGRTHKVTYGKQIMKIRNTKLVVLPSTSGAANGFWNEKYWHMLANVLKS